MDVMTEEKLVPKLRFREFQDDWEKNKLADVATFYNSKRVALTASDREKGEYPYYGASGIIDYVKDFIFEGEYILLGEDGANIVMRNSRLVFLAKGKFWLNNHAHIFQSKDSNTFLCEALERINYTKYNSGTAQPKLNSDVVKKIQLHLPSFPEQQKIASFLSAVDKKLQQLTKKKELLEEYKKGVMQKIFSQELRFKNDSGNNYPDWEEKKLGNELEHKSIRNKSNQVDLVLSVSNKKGFISQQEQFRGHLVASKDVTNYKVVNKGEYAYNPSRINVGSIARLDNFEKGIVSPMYVIFRLKNNLNPFFFDALYSSHRFKYLIKIGCSGSVRDSLNFDDMEKFEVKLPCIEEQKKIADFLSSLDSKIDLVSRKIENTKAFKKGLLQQMFV